MHQYNENMCHTHSMKDSCSNPINKMHYHNNNCNCDKKYKTHEPFTHIDNHDLPIAMAYVPWQEFKNVYSINDGCFFCGTIFKDLDKPFLGRRI